MTAVYALALSLGVVALLVWLVMAALATNLEGWDWLHPDNGIGRIGQDVIAALVGVGMGGLSGTFAGWSIVPALGAALAGGLALMATARMLRTT